MKKEKINKEPLIYRFLYPGVITLFRIIFRPKLSGTENIPKDGAFILAGNHIKFLDCFTVISSTRRCLHFLAKAELFKYPITNWFFNTAGIIPVHRERKDKAALDDAIRYLEHGCAVGIFPEGRVNKTEERLLPLKFGAVKMASQTNTVVVPFSINGRYRPFRRSIDITFHKPTYIDPEKLPEENQRLYDIIYSGLREK
ncbi:MAG: 1-acyl-sn-glycerol-3-phosphate acyltransferase [Clostridia bacterium]|nr:1-acyl-sn-glycerol-3-phosphate acyltransferase [Clostridia bacterium]